MENDKPNTYKLEHLSARKEENQKDVDIELPGYLPVLQVIYNTVGRLMPRLAAEMAYYFFGTPMRRAKHRREDALLRDVNRFSFAFRDEHLQGYNWGDAGRKILLLHGWESRGTALRSLVPHLLEEGYSVWTFDAPAHGESPGKKLTLPIYGSAVEAFWQEKGPFDVIITHSFGGAAALYCLAHVHPSPDTELIMIAVPARISTIIEDFNRYLKMPPRVVDAFRDLLEKRLQRGLDEIELHTLYRESGLDRILLIHDELDHLVPVSEAYFLAENMPGATLALTKGYGHFLILRQEAVVERVVREVTERGY